MAKPKQQIPQISSSTTNLPIWSAISSALSLFNIILISCTYGLLLFQTIYVLSARQPKYINLRHICLKWIIHLFLTFVKQGISDKNDLNIMMIIFLIDFIMLILAYPSNIMKSIHLKYFSHQEKLNQSQSILDSRLYSVPFTTRLMISIAVGLLGFVRFVIAFIEPQNRRQVEDALRQINVTVIEGKCFWSIYQGKQKNDEKSKDLLKDYLIPGKNLKMSNSQLLFSHSSQSNDIDLIKPSPIEVKAYGEKCSNIIQNGFKPLKKVTITYRAIKSELQIVDVDFGKLQKMTLQQMTEKDSQVLELTGLISGDGEEIETVYIKFKSSQQMANFVAGVESAQRYF